MKATMKKFVITGLAMAAGVLAVGGCDKNKEKAPPESFFQSEDITRKPQRFADLHAAAGARADGTLRNYHFDCGKLNSLGEHKLDLMLMDDEACVPMIVHLDMPDNDEAKARKASIVAYLKDQGLADDQVKFEGGPNPKVTSPAAPNLAALPKTDTSVDGHSADPDQDDGEMTGANSSN